MSTLFQRLEVVWQANLDKVHRSATFADELEMELPLGTLGSDRLEAAFSITVPGHPTEYIFNFADDRQRRSARIVAEAFLKPLEGGAA